MSAPTYHDLHITTHQIPRVSIFNLPYDLEVSCCRVTGWQLWRHVGGKATLLAGEYAGAEQGLILDVAGHVICDSINREDSDT